jgi:transposase-like protein
MVIVSVQNAEQNTYVNKFCPFCQKQHIIKAGFRKRAGNPIQQYKCQDCGRWFIKDRIRPYSQKYVHHSQETISEIAKLYKEGYGLKAIQSLFQAKGEYLSTTTVWEYLKKKGVSTHRKPILPVVDIPKTCPLCQGTSIVCAGFRYRTRTMERLEKKFRCNTCGQIFFRDRLPNSRRWKYPKWLMQFAIRAYQEPKMNARKVSELIKARFNISIGSGNIRRWLVINNFPRKKPWETIAETRIERYGENAFKPSLETRFKISQTLKGKSYLSEEARKRLSGRMSKLWSDPTFREQVSSQIRDGWKKRKTRLGT